MVTVDNKSVDEYLKYEEEIKERTDYLVKELQKIGLMGKIWEDVYGDIRFDIVKQNRFLPYSIFDKDIACIDDLGGRYIIIDNLDLRENISWKLINLFKRMEKKFNIKIDVETDC